MNDKLTPHEFIIKWKEELLAMTEELDAFERNMVHLKIKSQSYTDWIKTWVAWSELGSDEDIDNYF